MNTLQESIRKATIVAKYAANPVNANRFGLDGRFITEKEASDAQALLDYLATKPSTRLEVAKHFRNGYGQFNHFAEFIVGMHFLKTVDITLPHVNRNRYGIQWVDFIEVNGKWEVFTSDYERGYSDYKKIEEISGSDVPGATHVPPVHGDDLEDVFFEVKFEHGGEESGFDTWNEANDYAQEEQEEQGRHLRWDIYQYAI